ncbi:MAG: succinate dehydrogenase cytochrome b subunit [Bacteroides sp.]|nr:succinate dehydrogenase cytochrome b subunit [Bacteroides sp.]
MWLSSSSVGRKFVMAVTGAVLVLFVTFHCLMNTVAICWPVAYNCICEFLGANWYALVASAGLALFIIIHIIYAVMLTLQNRKARGADRYLVVKKPATVEWSSQNMLVLGIVILAFLVVHLIQFWAKMQLVEILGKHGALPPTAGTLFLQEAFSTNWTWIVYVVGFCALWFHMNHGFWSMFQSVGWDNQVWICRLKKISCWWTSIVVALFLAQAIVFTVMAHKDYYKTDSALRAQYQEMISPMIEESFGPQAADQLASAPFDQMKQMINGTLSQMQAPEAQSYFANDPEYPKRLETLQNVAKLIEYLDVEVPVENEIPANPQPTNN